MARREFSGRSAAEAAIHACETLGMSRSQLRYEVLSESGAGLERRVVISVDDSGGDRSPAAPVEGRDAQPAYERPERQESRYGGRSDRGGDRGGDRGHGGRPPRRDGRSGRGGDRGERGGRRHEPRTFGNQEPEDGGIDALLNMEAVPANSVAAKEAMSGAPSPEATRASEVLNEMLKRLGMDVAAVRVGDDDAEIQFDLRGPDEQRIIGKKGDALLALQFLVNRMIGRDEAGSKRAVLDAAGYRERRRSALADLAKKLAARALEEHKVVRLSPMSAHDRRIFHITLEGMAGVSTRSEGNGLFRNLLIIPAEAEAR